MWIENRATTVSSGDDTGIEVSPMHDLQIEDGGIASNTPTQTSVMNNGKPCETMISPMHTDKAILLHVSSSDFEQIQLDDNDV